MHIGIADNLPIVYWSTLEERAKFWSELAALGATEVRLPWYVHWVETPGWGTRLTEAVAAATSIGCRVSIVLLDENDAILTAADRTLFAARCARFASNRTGVYRFIVWNEPNIGTFWAGSQSSDPAVRKARIRMFASTLAATRDAIKAARPGAVVAGFGLAASHDPGGFLDVTAEWLKDSRRTRSLMDELSFHPYPLLPRNAPGDPIFSVRHILERFDAAFTGTPQKVGVKVGLDEFGWQTAETGEQVEISKTVDEAVQADYLKRAAAGFAAIPRVTHALNYKLADERDLRDWQSGLLRADWKRKPGFDALARR